MYKIVLWKDVINMCRYYIKELPIIMISKESLVNVLKLEPTELY